MSSLFGTIDYLNRNIDYKSYSADKTIRKIAAAGDPVKTTAQEKGGGGVHFAANLQNLNKYKLGSINAFQNALSMMQIQSEGLRQAEKIYGRMLSVAQMASDPTADDQTRELLAKEFADLRDQSVAINAMTINGKNLFDARAASTQYKITFMNGNQQQSGNPADGTEWIVDPNNNLTQQNYWEVTKDVIYNSGKLTVKHMPFTASDRVVIFQEDRNNPIFDSGWWTTSINGTNPNNNDFDQFTIRYGPDIDTTFQFTPLDSDGDGNYENKNKYLNSLGLSSDDGSSPTDFSTSGWASRTENKYSQLGMVSTGESNPNSSNITVRIIATGTEFYTGVEWEPLDLEDEVVGRSDDMQVNLNQMGLGYLRHDESGFPTISVGTTTDALKAIDVLRAEIDNIGEQNGRLGSNYTRVENAMDASQKQLITQEKVLAESVGTDITADLLKLSTTRIERQQNAALMTQAMSIHQDIVNLLI